MLKPIILDQKAIQKKLERIKKTFINKSIHFSKTGYPYSFFTLTDFEPPIEPSLVEDMADLLVHYGNFDSIDLLVSEADRGGGPLTHAVSMRTNIPYTLANWYPNGGQGELHVKASVGFSGKGDIFLNGIKKGQRIILVDDLLSSGGTALALIRAVHKGGAIIKQALFVAEKVLMCGRQKLENNYSIPIISLVKFKAEKGYTKEFTAPFGLSTLSIENESASYSK
ncbi:MAG: phosphoribosyltransferase family protein [bacterium]|nr:phosphoribosyltransferase family protein [bacterium]